MAAVTVCYYGVPVKAMRAQGRMRHLEQDDQVDNGRGLLEITNSAMTTLEHR